MPDALSLPVWLRQQIQADRDLALAAKSYSDGQWTATRSHDGYLHKDGPRLETGGGEHWSRSVNLGVWLCDDPGDDCEALRGEWMREGEHAARWDPAAVLADLDAKLRIVDLHSGGHECSVYDHHGEIDDCRYVHDFELCSTLRLLAVPYTGRAGYLETWRAE